jgi:Undecaprenyl-phosphate glucose phosphotransferase
MHIYRTFLYFFRISIDVIIIIAAFLLSASVSSPGFNFLSSSNAQLLLPALLVIWLFTTKATGLYDEFRSRNTSFELMCTIKNVVVLFAGSMIILFLLNEQYLLRMFAVTFALSTVISLCIEKIIMRYSLNKLRKKGRNLRNLLIVGAGRTGRNFYDLIAQSPHFGYHLVGFLDDNSKPWLNGQYLGKIDQLDSILEKKEVNDVIVALPNTAMNKLEEVIRTCEKHTTRVKIIPDYFKFVSEKYNVSMFGGFPVISVRDDRINEFHWRLLKRVVDLILSLLVLVLIFSWLYPIVSLLIKLSSQGPVLFKQERWGRDNRKFIAYKFRSMEVNSTDVNEDGKYMQAIKNDPRVTKVGRFLRKTSLDELPQFWNVLKGEMSIVGPRPHPIPLNLESKEKVRLYMLRHIVKPGITGWAQVNGYRGPTKDLKLMQSRIDHDVWYIENWSFMLDLQIIILTLWRIVRGSPGAF